MVIAMLVARAIAGLLVEPPPGSPPPDPIAASLGAWYDYDFMTHVLTPKPVVYVVRTVEGNAFKLEVQGYYDEAGTSGIFTIRWAALDAG